MPRRFALLLLVLLLLLLGALMAARALKSRTAGRTSSSAHPTPRPTPVVPPTPIPPRLVELYFESPDDEKLHAEAREVPASSDDVALLRSVASAVLEGPRHAELVKPFPDGWRLRSAFTMADGLAVVDLIPPEAPAPAEGFSGAPRWNAGAHEEEVATQALLLSVTRNLPAVKRVVLLVGGEPVDTLGGHLDLAHPLRADPERASDAATLPALSPVPTSTAAPAATPSPAGTPVQTPPPTRRAPRRPASETA